MLIDRAAIDAVIAHARDEAPDECCGLLVGSAARIEEAHRAHNLRASPSRFLIDPQDHFRVIRAARTAGRQVVGVYHSHPSTAATPSAADLADATYAEYAYVIVSLASERPDVRLFRLQEGRFVEEPAEVSPAPITIVDDDPRWPELFEREADRIRGALGRRALRIEHAGSTAVPGLPAKPIIDLLLIVADSSDEETYMPSLEAAGYSLRIRETDWYEHRLFKGTGTDINLHVFSSGCPEIDRMLMFRDRLRSHAADRDLYARTKLALAKKQWTDVQNYADAKTAVVDEIIARARSDG